MNESELKRAIEELESDGIPPQVAENKLLPILQNLLGNDGYEVSHTGGAGDQGIDFLAVKGMEQIAIQQKHYSRKDRSIGLSDLYQMLGSMIVQKINRVMMISNTRFSSAAREFVSKTLPVQFELIDIDTLKAWGSRLGREETDLQQEAIRLITDLSRSLVLLVAKDPKVLDVVEWRELEKLLAEVFSGIGFNVTLTPSSKDGGKDLILETKCTSRSTSAIYIVEIKHWRSGQRVGSSAVTDFLNVILKECREGGVFLSTYGYCDNAFEQLSEIDRTKVRFGNQTKIITLCKQYEKIKSGIWTPTNPLGELLYQETE